MKRFERKCCRKTETRCQRERQTCQRASPVFSFRKEMSERTKERFQRARGSESKNLSERKAFQRARCRKERVQFKKMLLEMGNSEHGKVCLGNGGGEKCAKTFFFTN